MTKLILVLFILPAVLYGQGYQVNLQGQISQGMGGAGGAYMQDGSSLFFNPGGSCFINRNEVNIGMTTVFSNVSFLEHKTNSVARTNSPVGTPFAAYGLFQIKDSSRLKLGMGIYTPFGSTIEWEDKWAGRFALTRLKLFSIFFQPTISFRISKKIGLGAGFVYGYGNVNLQKDLPLMDTNGDYGTVELEGKGHGFGFNVGLYFEPTEHLKVGISYRSQLNIKLTQDSTKFNVGTATFNVPGSLDDKFPETNYFSSSLPMPQVFTLSLGITPNEKLAILFDANYVGWDAYDTLSFDYSNNTESLEDTKSVRNYQGSISIRLGAQYKVTPKIPIRAGIAFAISPVQNGYVTPETPDNNRVNYTVGMGYNISQKFDLNASLLFTQVSREDTNLETGLSGKFKTLVWAPGLSVTYKF